jgi:hypothetical protein
MLKQTKSPLSYTRQRALNLVLPANFASHTRRRAMRVMVVVMVPVRHEVINLRDWCEQVNPENAIAAIAFLNATHTKRITTVPWS